jgi:CDP-2,3-bis-(O-geranylgeranyl)-sn-glycerol synthase
MLKELIFVWWFFAPSGVANVAAFFSGKNKHLKRLAYPIDCGVKLRGRRFLGDHKTVGGFVFGILASIAIVYLQIFLFQNFAFVRDMVEIDYSSVNPIIFGFLSGFGALFGDSVKSFFKRQANIQPGKSWVPFDQIDYILGGILFTSFYIRLSLEQYIMLFFVWFLLHPATTLLGYIFKIREEPL